MASRSRSRSVRSSFPPVVPYRRCGIQHVLRLTRFSRGCSKPRIIDQTGDQEIRSAQGDSAGRARRFAAPNAHAFLSLSLALLLKSSSGSTGRACYTNVQTALAFAARRTSAALRNVSSRWSTINTRVMYPVQFWRGRVGRRHRGGRPRTTALIRLSARPRPRMRIDLGL